MPQRVATQPHAPEAFEIAEFCERYRIGRSTLYQMWREGRGPATVRYGRKVVVPRRAADAWQASMLASSQEAA